VLLIQAVAVVDITDHGEVQAMADLALLLFKQT
jgi:hypothetical protein